MLKNHDISIGPPQRTAAWYSMRTDRECPRFGASQAAGLLGLSEYTTPLHIYRSFTEGENVEDNIHMLMGRVMEKPIMDLYAVINERDVIHDIPCFISKLYPLFASLDGADVGEKAYKDGNVLPFEQDDFYFHSDRWVAPVEGKWSMSPNVSQQLGEEGSDWIPNEWFCQTQQQMLVCGFDHAFVAALVFGRLRTFRISRDDVICDALISSANELRERILNEDPPEPSWTHPQTPKLVRSMGQEGVEVMEATTEMAGLWMSQKAINDQIKELTKSRDELRSRFEYAMVQAQAGAAVLEGTGKQVVRRKATRRGYTVKDTSFIELRELNIK